MIVWAAFIFLAAYFGFSVSGYASGLFVKFSVGLACGSASLWWLWMMRVLDCVTPPSHPPEAK